MNNETMQTIKEIGIVTVTAAGGTSLYLTVAQTYIGMFGVLAAAFASIVIAIRNIRDMFKEK